MLPMTLHCEGKRRFVEALVHRRGHAGHVGTLAKPLTMPISVSKGRIATAAAVSGQYQRRLVLFHQFSDLADNEIAEHRDTVGVPHFLWIDKIDVDVGALEFGQNWNQVGGFLVQIVR